MNESLFYYFILVLFLVLALIVFIILLKTPAPYGKFIEKGWGPLINHKLGWILQEAPASLMMLCYFFTGSRSLNATMVILLVIWQTHYFHRAFIYPFTLRSGNRVPLTTVLLAILFNIANTYLQGRWLFSLAPSDAYSLEWLQDPRFIIGALIFYTGYIINKVSDRMLRNLRKPGEKGYKVPRGWLFEYISCPNYFGEIVTWIGWALATWSLAGIFFVLCTLANLGPRALSNHLWYKKTFPDYPEKRKALIPYIL